MLFQNKKGNISILFVISSFTFMLVAMFFLNIIYSSMSKNEVQGILDNSGVMALRYAVNETDWRDEKLTVDKGVAKAKFRRLVAEQISVSDTTLLKEFEIIELRVYGPDEVGALGIPSGSRDQYFLEAIANVKYNSGSTVADVRTNSTNRYFNFFTGQNEARMYGGVEGDKQGELVIRSVSRIVLR